MSQASRKMRAEVTDVTYVGTTRNGNTRHRIHAANGHTWITAPDSSAGLDAQNVREGDHIEFTTDGLGRINGLHSCIRNGAVVWWHEPIS